MKDPQEFYLGYAPKAPRGLARAVRSLVIALLAITALVSMILVFGQHRFAASFFEFGVVREFAGELRAKPYPVLLTGKNGGTGNTPPVSSYALVAQGKHGADSLVAGLDGQRVKLRGSLIYRDRHYMIEVVPGSIVPDGLPAKEANQTIEDLGRQTLIGEIVDSKCYLGVMNPGQTKPHRECASLCIRGGIPPLFVVRDAGGREVDLWLVSETGQPVNREVLDFVAEPVEITGTVVRDADRLVLKIDRINRI